MTDFLVREIDVAQDAVGLLKIDTSFSSDRIFGVEFLDDDSLRLRSVAVAEAINWRFPLLLEAEPWEYGLVASRGSDILGFIATAYGTWNRRLAIWHYYVDRPYRKLGIGRALMDRAIAYGRELGATRAWLETSNLNGSGVLVYQKLGFGICGFDLTLYRGTPSEGQFAMFLDRAIDRDGELDET